MIIILFGAILPLVLWPVEVLFPYPHIVEEIAKGMLVYWILTTVSGKTTQIKIAILVATAFAFSESILYLFNILQVGTGWTFLNRLLLTIPFNILTILVMLFLGMWKRWFLTFGILAAILLHYGFNLFVGML